MHLYRQWLKSSKLQCRVVNRLRRYLLRVNAFLHGIAKATGAALQPVIAYRRQKEPLGETHAWCIVRGRQIYNFHGDKCVDVDMCVQPSSEAGDPYRAITHKVVHFCLSL